MKTLLTAAALLAFTAGTAAAGCGHLQTADKSKELDTVMETGKDVDMSTPATSTGESEPAGTQTAMTPDDEASEDAQ